MAVRASPRSQQWSACVLPMQCSRRFTIAGPGRARATSGTAGVVVVVVVGCITTSASAGGDRMRAARSARWEHAFRRRASIRIGLPTLAAAGELARRAGRLRSDRQNLRALLHGRHDRPDRGELPSPDDGDSPATHNGPRSAPRKRVRPRDRHAARAIAMIGAVTASSCQVSPRSGLRSSRPSAMPQTSSPARAASVYGIDSPGTGSSRQVSPSQR